VVRPSGLLVGSSGNRNLRAPVNARRSKFLLARDPTGDGYLLRFADSTLMRTKSACSDGKNPHIPVTQPYWQDLARAQSRDESPQFEGNGREIADESTGIRDHVQHYVLARTTKRNAGVGSVSGQKRGSIVEAS